MRQQRRFGFGILCSAAVGALILGGASPVFAQGEDMEEAEGPTKDASGKVIPEPTVNEGELRADGKVKAIMGANRFIIEMTSFTTARGKTVEFPEAKSKAITTTATTLLHPRGDLKTKSAFSDVKLGLRITIIGKDLGSGKALEAREIVLWPERTGDTRRLTTVRVSREVSRLVDQGDEAYQLRDLPSALRLFERAIASAAASGDRRGQALSLGRAARVYSDMEEPDRALQLQNQGLAIWQGIGNPDNQAISLLNIASLQSQKDDNDAAIQSLEQANGLVQNSSNRKLVALTFGHLANAYASGGQHDKALTAFERALPLVSGQTDKGAEADLLADMAHLFSISDREERARQTLEQVAPMLEAIGDRRERVVVLQTVARTHKNLKENDKAVEYLRQAQSLYQDMGDARGQEAMQRLISALEKGAKDDGGDDAP